MTITCLSILALAAQGTVAQPSPAPQSVSQVPLAVYGIDLRIDPAWIDGSQFPSNSSSFPNFGTSPALQQVWDALKPNGHNVARIPLDIRDAASANRAANLCAWAKNNNLQLIFVLVGVDSGQALPKDYPKSVSTFVNALATLLRNAGEQYLPYYNQIMAFQLEDELNHPGRHGGMTASAATRIGLQAAKALRQAETEVFKGTDRKTTQVIISMSFDFPLIHAKAIAGTTLTDAAYKQAYQDLKVLLAGLSTAGEVDFLTIDWFAGSISAGNSDKFTELLQKLIDDVPGKQLMLTTGFSSAFHTPAEQQAFATGIAGLAGFCTGQESKCRFAGMILHEAQNGKNPDPPRPTLPGEMLTWAWQAKAAELEAMWTKQKKSADMAWWLASVENNMGLVGIQGEPSQVAVSSAAPESGSTPVSQPTPDGAMSPVPSGTPVNDSSVQQPSGMNTTGAPGCAPQSIAPVSLPGQPPAAFNTPSTGTMPCEPGFTQTFKTAALNGLGTLLQQVFTQVGARVTSKLGPSSVGINNAPTNLPGNPGVDPTSSSPSYYPGGQPSLPGGSSPTGYIPNSPVSSPPEFQNGTSQPPANTFPPQPMSTPAVTVSDPNGGAVITAGAAQSNGGVSPQNAGPSTSAPRMVPPSANTSANQRPVAGAGNTLPNPWLPGIPARPNPSPRPGGDGPTVSAPRTVQSGANTPANQQTAAGPGIGLPAIPARPNPLSRTGGNGPVTGSLPSTTVIANAHDNVRPGPARGTTSTSGTSLPPVTGRPGASIAPTPKPDAVTSGVVDLSVAGIGTLRMEPAQARLGHTATFTATISNLGTSSTHGTVTFFLLADGTEVGRSQPIQCNVVVNSSIPVSWTANLPTKGRFMEVKVVVTAVGDRNPANNTNHLTFSAANR